MPNLSPDITNPTSVNQIDKEFQQKIADGSTQAGFPITAEKVSVEHRFPLDLIKGVEVEVIEQIGDASAFVEAMKEGSSYARVTASDKPSLIASFREKLRRKFSQKKAA